MRGDMVDQIAKAIYQSRNGAGCNPWGKLPGAHKDPYRADALAALGALRKPTPEMVGAATRRSQGPDECLYASVFKAMIDAAIAQEVEA